MWQRCPRGTFDKLLRKHVSRSRIRGFIDSVRLSSDSPFSRPSHSTSVQIGSAEITLKGNHLARFADSAVVASTGDSAVLATCVTSPPSSAQSFDNGGVPLTVDFRQSAAAVGRIPTNYLRRELGQTDADILAGRVIDRSLRPIIDSRWNAPVQIVCKPLALDDEGDAVLLGLNAASAALCCSSIAIQRPVAGVRIALLDDELVLNPTRSQRRDSSLDLMLCGSTDQRIVMIEMDGMEVPVDVVEQAVNKGLEGVDQMLIAMNELQQKCGKGKLEPYEGELNTDLVEQIREMCADRVEFVFTDATHDKVSRDDAIRDICEDVVSSLADEVEKPTVRSIYSKITKDILRNLILNNRCRCDGRSIKDFRPISIEVDVYKKLHGSALFQRGQTQVLSTVTFDSPAAAFHPDSVSQLLGHQERKSFMLHYEFPSYATNTIGATGRTNRRELGHGALAEKALKHVVPKQFPYSIRVSSQVLESNGSSSMASACSGSLALFDAGVPLIRPVAGVAIGLVTDQERPDEKYEVLTDILGIEDYAGDMDFKVAGTSEGFTAMQLDVKIPGMSRKQFTESLRRGVEGLDHVLELMNSAISRPRDAFKSTVPVLETISLEPYKRSQLFRNSGYVAKTVEAETGVKISTEDDSRVQLMAPNRDRLADAKEMLSKIFNEGTQEEYNFGQIIAVEVVELMDRGALVRIQSGGRTYLIPNAQLSAVKVNHPSAAGIMVGQKLKVQWLGRDQQGNVRMSRRTLGSK